MLEESRVTLHEWLSGGVSPCQGEGRGFESRLVLDKKKERYVILLFLFIRAPIRGSSSNLLRFAPVRPEPRSPGPRGPSRAHKPVQTCMPRSVLYPDSGLEFEFSPLRSGRSCTPSRAHKPVQTCMPWSVLYPDSGLAFEFSPLRSGPPRTEVPLDLGGRLGLTSPCRSAWVLINFIFLSHFHHRR